MMKLLTLKLNLVRTESEVVVNESSLFPRKHRKDCAFCALASLFWPFGTETHASSGPRSTCVTHVVQFWNLACLSRSTAWNC